MSLVFRVTNTLTGTLSTPNNRSPLRARPVFCVADSRWTAALQSYGAWCYPTLGHLPMIKYFYDIPVYRLPADVYHSQRDAYIEGVIAGYDLQESHSNDTDLGRFFRDHLWRRYGGAWRFNETIGFLRLHFLGNQIRGEWWQMDAKRVSKTRKKQFAYRSHKLASEKSIVQPSTNKDIYLVILEYLDACRCELPKWHLDTELFEVVGPHLDWNALVKAVDVKMP